MNFKSCFARFRSLLTLALLATFAGTASAHPGHAGHDIGGIGWGLAHPFTGFDHLLAMVAVGLWAVQLGGRALWMLPLSFVGAMALGGAFGMGGLVLPQVEPMILGSALVLGAMVAIAARLPMAASVAIVAGSAFFHGQAHGVEMPSGANGWMTALGFVLATAALHGAGVGGGKVLQQVATPRAVRACGAAIVAVAVLMSLGAF
jgi:urease accessory protein